MKLPGIGAKGVGGTAGAGGLDARQVGAALEQLGRGLEENRKSLGFGCIQELVASIDVLGPDVFKLDPGKAGVGQQVPNNPDVRTKFLVAGCDVYSEDPAMSLRQREGVMRVRQNGNFEGLNLAPGQGRAVDSPRGNTSKDTTVERPNLPVSDVDKLNQPGERLSRVVESSGKGWRSDAERMGAHGELKDMLAVLHRQQMENIRIIRG